MTDTTQQAPAKLQVTLEHLQQVNGIVQHVAATATLMQQTTGQAPTNEQKLQAALEIASLFYPQLGQLVIPVTVLIESSVALFNSFKMFHSGNNPTSTPT